MTNLSVTGASSTVLEFLILGALNTIISALPYFIKNPNSAASARLRHYVQIAITELQQFEAVIPPADQSKAFTGEAGE